MRRLFWLYRPTLPSVRAQSIQVLSMAHAMARRGHRVTLCADGAGTVDEILAWYGLDPVDTLELCVLPRSRTLGSIRMRFAFARFLLDSRGEGIVVARSKRRVREALGWGKRFRLVLEVHEVDSEQAREAGRDPEPSFLLEREVLASADGVVANAPGTLALLRRVHEFSTPAIALHNGTDARRVRTPAPGACGVGYAGSVRDAKDLRTLAEAARLLGQPVTLVTADDPTELVRVGGGFVVAEPALPYRDVPDRLRKFRVLVLPLSKGLFGEQLTSPLKLWDYQASGVPIVGADTPALRDAANGAFIPYVPGDAASLASALHRALTDEGERARVLAGARVRTWDQRALELDAFLDSLPDEPSRSRSSSLRPPSRSHEPPIDVLYVLRYFPTVSETFVYREITELRSRGRNVAILALGERWDGALQDDLPPVTVYRPPRHVLDMFRSRPEKTERRVLWATELARSLGVRRVHAHFVGEPSRWASAIAGRIGVPWSVTAHANDLYGASDDDLSCLRSAAPVVVVAEAHAAFLRERGVDSVVVRCGVDPSAFPARRAGRAPPEEGARAEGGARPQGAAPEPLRVVSVARNVPKKGLDVLVRAARGRTDVTLTLVSDHPAGTGLLPPSRIPALLGEADVFVLPCRVAGDGDRDGIPVALMEAMAAGLPVVTTGVGGIPELVDEEVGWLLPADDVASLSDALGRIARDPDERVRRGRAARRRIEAGWTLSRQVDDLLAAWS